jgi:peptidoglycan/LPS O-acetylase OafA/YrhL
MHRQRALDGLRGCAILWVLAYHLVALPAKPAAYSGMAGVMAFASYGWIGVNLFFVLSGYLITQGLFLHERDRAYFANFWVRRAFRIVPAYALLLVSFVAAKALWPSAQPGADGLFNSVIPFWSYLVFTQNMYMASLGYLGNDWLRVLWSLAVEVQFYLFISVALFLIPRRQAAWWLSSLVVASVLFRYLCYFNLKDPDASLVVLLPSRLDGFLLGGLLAIVPRDGRVGSRLRRPAASIAFLLLSVAFLGTLFSGRFGSATHDLIPLYYSAMSVGCAALLDLCAAPFRPVQWLMERGPLVEAGRLSYFIYLFHMPIALVVFRVVLGTAPTLATASAILVMMASVAAIYGAAWLSYAYFEAPLIRFSHSLVTVPGGPPAAASASAAAD